MKRFRRICVLPVVALAMVLALPALLLIIVADLVGGFGDDC